MIHAESMLMNTTALVFNLLFYLYLFYVFNDSVVGSPDVNSATRKMSDLTVVLHLSLHTCS